MHKLLAGDDNSKLEPNKQQQIDKVEVVQEDFRRAEFKSSLSIYGIFCSVRRSQSLHVGTPGTFRCFSETCQVFGQN